MTRVVNSLAGLLLALGIGLGAYGAHAPLASPELWQTAWHLHLFHALSLILVAQVLRTGAMFVLTLQFVGLIFFSGSLYLQSLGWTQSSPLAPVGGVSWILSWLFFAFFGFRMGKTYT